MKIYIFDIDQTISDTTHRQHFAERKDWNRFHNLCDLDAPLQHCAGHLDRLLVNAESASVVDRNFFLFITGRPERYKDVTRTWLLKHFPKLANARSDLLMRPELDFRKSPDVKERLLNLWLERNKLSIHNIEAVYDDREDVRERFAEMGIHASRIFDPARLEIAVQSEELARTFTAADILEEAARTFRERNGVYDDNYKLVAPIVKVLFPEGVPSELVEQDHWHLFELILVKLTRFARSGLTHQDSMRDTAVYAAMIEAILKTGEENV